MNGLLKRRKEIIGSFILLGALVSGVWALDEKYDQSNEVENNLKEIKTVEEKVGAEIKYIEQKAGAALSSVIIMLQEQRVYDLSNDVISLQGKEHKSQDDVKKILRKQLSIDAAQRMIDKFEKK